MDCSPTGLLCPRDSPGKNAEVVAISFSRGSSQPGVEPMSPEFTGQREPRCISRDCKRTGGCIAEGCRMHCIRHIRERHTPRSAYVLRNMDRRSCACRTRGCAPLHHPCSQAFGARQNEDRAFRFLRTLWIIAKAAMQTHGCLFYSMVWLRLSGKYSHRPARRHIRGQKTSATLRKAWLMPYDE